MRTIARRIFPRLAALLLAMLLLGAVLPVSASAQEPAGETVKVGFFAMDGYHMMDESGARSGYGYEFMRLIAKYSNLRFEYIGYDKSWEEMQQMLLDGEIDLLTSAQKTEEREALFGFSANQIGTSAALLTVKAGDSRYADGDYSGMRMGLVKGSSRNDQLASFMRARGFSYTPVYYDNMYALTEALQEGSDIDAAMTGNLRRTDNEWTLETLNPSPFFVMVRKDDVNLLDQVNAAIERMDVISAGWRTRLFNQYYTSGAGDVVAFTAEERDYLNSLKSSGRKLKATMNPDCAPYSYFVDGEAKGIIADIFAEVAARMGIDYEMVVPADREDYFRLCTEGGVDIILDGLADEYTTEENHLEIGDVYYTTPLAMVTEKTSAGEAETLAQPGVGLLNESFYAEVFSSAAQVDRGFNSYRDAVAEVKRGQVDGAIMPYYCAQWIAGEDETGRLRCLMLPLYERDFVYAVSDTEDYTLLSSLNKALGSLSDDYISSVAAADTEHPAAALSLAGMIYRYPILCVGAAALLVALVAVIVFLVGRSRRASLELARSRRMERYIGYLCDMYDRLLEVDLDLGSRRQYVKRGSAVEITETSGFTGFDIDSIHPDDREACLAMFAPKAIRARAATGEGESYVECRMRSGDGEYRWYSFLLRLIPVDAEHPCSAMLLIKDIDELHRERARSHDALVNALDAANAASRSKSTFLSNMSHEIRTPLNAMIGYMTIASGSIDNRDKVLHCIESAGVSARHLLNIINDILDISSMESGRMKLARERFDLKEQLSGVATAFYQQCRLKNIQFDIIIRGLTEEWVVGDSMRVSQVLMNLMSNAVKFTSEGGVSLTVTQTSKTNEQVYMQFVVKDSGIGMSKEYLDRLFEPFEQESAQTARKYGGTGLGMPITLNLINLMGGNIDVESEQGRGTVFTVMLPFGRTDNSELKAVSRDFSHLNVLIVDDTESDCEYMQALLKRFGARCEAALSGQEALRLVSARKDTPECFDLCIIDWNMPGFNGVETTRLIHQQCDPDIPIVIATAYDISEFEREARAAGAARILSKPLFQSTLLDLLVSTCGKYEPLPEADGSTPDLSGMHVLMAEDNETNVDVAVDLLEIAGVTADVARNGREAVDCFMEKGDSYDAILMDVQMPVMDGYAATRAIRASSHPRAATIPIIALTADAFAENVSEALAAGMDDHIAKPIETGRLFAALSKAYGSRKD